MADELPSSLTEWWDKFQTASAQEREQLILDAKEESLLNPSSTPGKSRRRRRRSPKQQALTNFPDDSQQGL